MINKDCRNEPSKTLDLADQLEQMFKSEIKSMYMKQRIKTCVEIVNRKKIVFQRFEEPLHDLILGDMDWKTV